MELSELIESVDILEYISQYTEFTEKNGEYWALSPLKDENTPSFSVRKEENSFYDFSSGIGGNVLTFIRYYNKCGYQKAIEILEAYAGCNGTVRPHKKLSATEVAKRFSKPKKTPKTSKGVVLQDDYMARYEKRDDKLAVWEQEGISRASLDKFQVFYDSFSDRLVYPIRNMDGKIVNIGGRTLDDDWKAKGLRKYTYFKPWGELNTIYGLPENMDFIREKREIILFEGCKSVLLADTWGIHNAGAILTSHLKGVRVSLFVSGCDFHCPGCFNPEAQSFEYGERFDSEVAERIVQMVSEPTISGLSILGGDPLCQSVDGLITLSMLCNRVRFRGKTVWLWTGFTWEDVFSLPCRDTQHQYQKFLIADCNVVVDGSFKQELADRKLVWKGSSNQRVIDVQASLRAGHVVTYQN